MSTPIRKKRNFKPLKIKVDTDPPTTMTPKDPPTKPAGKKRPPPMTLKAPKIGASSTPQDHDGTLLTVSNGLPSSAPPTASASKMYHSALSEKLANYGEDLKNEDLKDIQELGQGNGGSVKKVEHIPTGMIMAKKVCVFSFTYVRSPRISPLLFRSARADRAWCRPFYYPSLSSRTSPIDRVNRRETVGKKANPAGAANHARL